MRTLSGMRTYLEAVGGLNFCIVSPPLMQLVNQGVENGRLTIMFCAFEGPPRIVRLWGKGTVHEFDTPKYNALIPPEKRQPGSRSVIMQEVEKVSTVRCTFFISRTFDFEAGLMLL